MIEGKKSGVKLTLVKKSESINCGTQKSYSEELRELSKIYPEIVIKILQTRETIQKELNSLTDTFLLFLKQSVTRPGSPKKHLKALNLSSKKEEL